MHIYINKETQKKAYLVVLDDTVLNGLMVLGPELLVQLGLVLRQVLHHGNRFAHQLKIKRGLLVKINKKQQQKT